MKHQSIKVILVSMLLLLTAQMSFAGAIHGKKFKDWQGRCQQVQNKDFCFILQGFSADGKKALMITTVDVGQHAKYPLVTFIVSAMLDDSKEIQFKVDKNQPIGLKAQCTEKECSIVFPLDKRMLREFKRGNRGIIGFIAKDTGKPVYFPVSLAGFTKAFNTLKKS